MCSQGPCQTLINGGSIGITEQRQIDSCLTEMEAAPPRAQLGTTAQKTVMLPLKRSVTLTHRAQRNACGYEKAGRSGYFDAERHLRNGLDMGRRYGAMKGAFEKPRTTLAH
jgi:hypothetical protein